MKKYIGQLTMLCLFIITTISCKDNDEEILLPDPVVNQNPNNFNLIRVTNEAADVAVKPTLKWQATTDPDGDAISYFLYFDDQPNPTTLLAGNITTTDFQIEDRLSLEKQYYWRVVARDNHGNATKSNDTFSFTTRSLNFYNNPVTSSAPFSIRGNHSTTAFDNKIWVIGGDDGSVVRNDIWYSEDGITWLEAISPAPFAERTSHTATVFDNKFWVIGGQTLDQNQSAYYYYANDVWYSEDGVTWTEATSSAAFSGRINHTTVVFNDKLWIIGGYDANNKFKNDVWYSEDGVTWNEATSSTPFSARSHHTTVVFDDKLWVIGGYDNASFKNDIWYSADGSTWQEATPAADFSKRISHTSAVFDNKLWVFSGFNADGGVNYENDAWYSEDGVTWVEANSNTPFSGRYGHGTTVSEDKLWIIGGYDGRYKNDVWAMN